MKYLGALTDISVADVKVDLMRTAYANDRALLNTFDPASSCCGRSCSRSSPGC